MAEGMKLVWIGSKLPRGFQRFVGRIMMSKALPFLHSKRTGIMFGSGASKSTDLWEASGQKREIIEEVMTQWEHLRLDSVICNVMPFPAPVVNAPGMLPGTFIKKVLSLYFHTGLITHSFI